MRAKIKQLKKLKLIFIDTNKNIHLAPYQIFYDIIKFNNKYKGKQFKVPNKQNQTENIIKSIIISENVIKQGKAIFEKILVNEYCQIKEVHKITSGSLYKLAKENKTDKKIVSYLKKDINKNWDRYYKKYNSIFNFQYEQKEFLDKNTINPNIFCSCNLAAQLINKAAISTGFYNLKKLAAAGYINLFSHYTKIKNNSAAIYERAFGLRNDLFYYKYPTRLGIEKKYFINMPFVVESLIL